MLSKVSFAVRRRLPWLQVNLGTAFLAGAVVGLFESTIAQFTALAVLLPVVAGQSGNTGSQALAVTKRGLALREIRARHWLRVTLNEVATLAINGVAVAMVTALAVFFWSGSIGLAGVIAVAMVISMAIAGLAGASIPIVLDRLGQDPAQASSIVLTTVTDVVGFFSFLGLATVAAALIDPILGRSRISARNTGSTTPFLSIRADLAYWRRIIAGPRLTWAYPSWLLGCPTAE